MRNFIFWVLVSVLASSCVGNEPKTRTLDQLSALAGSGAVQQCETHPAKLVLMHTPSVELFYGVIHPAAALFEEVLSVEGAEQEHRGYIRALERAGAEVVTVREILEASHRDSLQVLAAASLIYSIDSTQFDPAHVEQYRQETLAKLDKQALINILLLQPTIQLSPTPTNTFVQASYVSRPLMNLFFQRDQTITTAKGTVVGKMNSPQRKRETEITDFCLRQLGLHPIHRMAGEGVFLEGGDFLPFEGASFLGQGMRTTQGAVDQLLDNDLLGQDTLVVVRDRFHWQMQMHLDTYFNIIDKDLVTLCANRLDAQPEDPEFLTIDIYARSGPGQPYERVVEQGSFVDYLRSRHMTIIPITGQDELHYANNFLTVGPRHILSVANQSPELAAKYAAHGVKVEWIELENLIRGYGAAHCMTQVLVRRD